MDYCIHNKEQLIELWEGVHNNEDGKSDWSHIIPYYAEDMVFKDTIQEIRGKEEFRKMTERLTERSRDLTMRVIRAAWGESVVFMEWEMSLSFKKYPNSKIYGASSVTLDESGKIIGQRDYYDLWGDIFDNIPRFGPSYRKFVKKKFG